MTSDATTRPRIWTPDARVIDPRDFEQRTRRDRRHGRERSRSEPMAAAVRTLDDSLAVKIANPELRDEWGHSRSVRGA